jgi:hypothetical protein
VPKLRFGLVVGVVSALALALAYGASRGTAAGDTLPTFGSPQLVAEASGVGGLTELETGDLNGDGFADVVVTRIEYPSAYVTHPIGIFLADGHGGFVDGSSLFGGPVPQTEHGRQILIADFNGDHRNDIFVADHGYDAPPFPGYPNTLVLSAPDGKLVDASGNLPAESGFSHSATAADIDGDGDLDIFVGNLCCTPPPPEILVNDGTGHFTLATGRLPSDVTDETTSYTRSLFIDVNKDGSPDLVLGGDGTNASRVLLNDRHGTFHDGSALPAKPYGANAILISIATLDVNADGYPDLLAGFTQSDPFYVGRRIQVLVNAGDGSFRDETATRLPVQSDGMGWPYAIRVADVNSDGHVDFGVSPTYPDKPSLFIDDGTGVFRVQDLPETQGTFAFVDANADGSSDLFSSLSGGNSSTERHFLQLQATTSSPPPPPPPPLIQCHVPKLKGKVVGVARSRIAEAHCRVGRVSRVKSAKRKGIVLSQRPRAGKTLPRSSRVNLVVSRGR